MLEVFLVVLQWSLLLISGFLNGKGTIWWGIEESLDRKKEVKSKDNNDHYKK